MAGTSDLAKLFRNYQPEPRKDDPVTAQPSHEPWLQPLPSVQEWGEQIVGSEHAHRVPLPLIVSPNVGSAMILASITKGGEAFSAEVIPRVISPTLNPADLRRHFDEGIDVRFRPPRAGAFKGELTIFASWPDGHTENQRIALAGHARDLGDAPEEFHPSPERPLDLGLASSPLGARTTALDEAPCPPGAVENLSALARTAAINARAVAANLQLGLRDVERRSHDFVAKPESHSMWRDLAEIAITMGVGVVAEIAAGAIVAKLGAKLAEGTLATADEVNESEVLKALAKKVKGGLEWAGEHTIGKAVAEQDKVSGQGNSAVSDFFYAQDKALVDLGVEAERLVDARQQELRPLLHSESTKAFAAMEAASTGLGKAAEIAEATQSIATTRAWITFKARDRLGTGLVLKDHKSTTVTALDEAREWTNHGTGRPSAHVDGLLDVHVVMNGDRVDVERAELTGVAQNLADRVLGIDLRAARMPLRVMVNDGAVVITRDEAGRVRVSGALWMLSDDHAVTPYEEKVQLGAQRVVDQVIARPLAAWGIRAIMTNDSDGEKGSAE